MNKTLSCLISYYNEGNRILAVLDALLKLDLNQIVVVDDGSTINCRQILKENYPTIKLLRYEKNHGKSKAIFEGLKVVSSDNVLLFDADLFDINLKHLKTAVDYFLNHQETDMVILKRMHDPLLFSRLIRTDIVNSGQRLLRTKDLREVFKSKFSNFQLELAINDYMIKNKKMVGWLPFSCYDPQKVQKFGFIRGAIKELKMMADLFSFKGFWYFFHCLFTFATEKLE